MPTPVSAVDLVLMRHRDALHLEHPFMGMRLLRDQLKREGFRSGVHTWLADGAHGHGGAVLKTGHQQETPLP